MKKTLVLTHEYYPFKGGVARYVYNLFKNFSPKDYLVVTDCPEVASEKNIIHSRLTWPLVKPSWAPTMVKIKKIIKSEGIEQIFTPNILPLGSLAYFLKIPYVISLHGLDINLALTNKPALTEKILTGAKHIIVNSINTKLALDGLGLDEDKISVIYPAVDFDESYDAAKLAAYRKKLEIADEQKVLLTVGRLIRRKGQDLVIEAMSQLAADYDLKYFIVGRGEEKQRLIDLIKEKKLEKRVFIFDNVDDEDLIYYYKLADIFVMPHRQEQSDVEGLGMVYLEAAKLGLPIISGNSGGVTEVFSPDDVLMVENGQLRSLLRHLKWLLKNPKEAVKLSKRGQEVVKNLTNIKENSQILANILH